MLTHSEDMAAFIDGLRTQGSTLPLPNWIVVRMLRRSLETADSSEWFDNDAEDDDLNDASMMLASEEVRDQLAADLEVIEEELRYREGIANAEHE